MLIKNKKHAIAMINKAPTGMNISLYDYIRLTKKNVDENTD